MAEIDTMVVNIGPAQVFATVVSISAIAPRRSGACPILPGRRQLRSTAAARLQPSAAFEDDFVVVLDEVACAFLEQQADGVLHVAGFVQARRLVERNTISRA